MRHLERRPEIYSVERTTNVQTLLLMDEFARFGKLEMITAAMATLQDVLLLTPFGFYRAEKFQMQNEEMRSLLLSNHRSQQRTDYETTDNLQVPIPIIKGRLISKDGVETPVELKVAPQTPCQNECATESIPDRPILPTIWNGGAKIMTTQERNANAGRRIYASELERRRKEQAEKNAQARKGHSRNFIIGEFVAKYFPEVLDLEPGTKEENMVNFEKLEAFLYVLSTDYELVRELRDRAEQIVSDDPSGEWRIPS